MHLPQIRRGFKIPQKNRRSSAQICMHSISEVCGKKMT
jgi:hypothetical protein